MDPITKAKDWIKEHAPMLAGLYENKYVGMLYDRFGSLPSKQQKNVLIGGVTGTAGLIFLYLFFSYWSLWSQSGKTSASYQMVNQLLQHQKERRDKSNLINHLMKNNQLAANGALKQHLVDVGRSANISPRMIQAEERPDAAPRSEEDSKNQGEIKIRQATVSLQRVTLTQLTQYLRNLEFGQFNLSISSLRISNDDKIRGYMTANLTVIAHLFSSDET